MSADKQTSRYDPEFAREFYALENGEYAKLCMQCGLCAVTCPTRHMMDLSPRQLFRLVQAGDREAVLNANTPWVCTSCLLCTVRCPRGIPIIDVMHGLKHALAEKGNKAPLGLMSRVFFQSMMKRGRVFEVGLTQAYYMKAGMGAMREAMKMADVGIDMITHKRLPPFPPKKIKGLDQMKKIYEKATALAKEEGHQSGI